MGHKYNNKVRLGRGGTISGYMQFFLVVRKASGETLAIFEGNQYENGLHESRALTFFRTAN